MQRDQFERIALEHLGSVHRLAWQLTRREDRADDLVQEVYLRAFRPETIRRFEQRDGTNADGTHEERSASDSVRSWLFTITHNTFYSLIKKQQQIRAVESGSAVVHDNGHTGVSEPDDVAVQAVNPPEPGGEQPPTWDLRALDWERVDERIKRSVEGLSPEYRQVLILWSVHEMKYREIADALGIPIGTVMSRLFRARKLLSESLGGEGGPAADLGIRNREFVREDQP